MSSTPSPRIGIIGTGAIGGFYGLLLARAGFDVHFLLRSEYETVSRQGCACPVPFMASWRCTR